MLARFMPLSCVCVCVCVFVRQSHPVLYENG